ncbi:MAG: glutamine-hydrolyzing carbamoyl-phosphate synthase small subunit, partial [Flavobacteriaceae bacterium]|nr:glutamine-hydrolyzing carbamoyl-phosphate synthase small subunit [Flavobacteriaceae bacterium]
LLQDGTIFHGKSVDGEGTAYGEICFNTGMTGYQEIFTDPSYFGQIMVTTNAHIGNYGTFEDDAESDSIKISGLVCRNFSYHQSRPKTDQTLTQYLNEQGLFAICNVDTRALVRHIRTKGAMNAVISTDVENIDRLKNELAKVPSMDGLALADKVSTQEAYYFGKSDASYKIAAIDLGIKKNILKNLAKRDCYIKVYPYDAKFEEVMQWQPDGLFLSNGPGDPQPLTISIEFAKKAIDSDLPVFGICLGHQLIALSQGVSTFKMHHGHRGINHPVLNLATGKGEITSQNHGFAVVREELENHPDLEITHVHLNDKTVAGLKHKTKKCFSVQYHPEAGPGPNDATYLFDQFVNLLKK